MNTPPRMSVLLPLQDEREAGVECIRAWLAQDADPSSYELLALAPGEDLELERAVRPLLRPADRWLVSEGADEYELFDFGAERGRGEFVFVTEAHCVPERDCLRAMLDELDRTGAPGIRGASVPDAQGQDGVLERDAFEQALSVEEDPEHWRKVLIHSLAIRRDLYLAAGGLPSRYGDFAPWVLAIALRERGERLAFSPRPRVHHVYDGALDHLGAHVRSFGRGEMTFRAEVPADLAERYLDYSVEWEQRLRVSRPGARRALGSAWSLRTREALRSVPRHAAVAVIGARGSILAARIGAIRAARRLRRASGTDRRVEFMNFWRLTSRGGRLEGLARAGGPLLAPTHGEPALRIDAADSLAGRAIGFYEVEQTEDGTPVRWTEPLAVLGVNVPGRGPVWARIDLHPRPGDAPANPKVAIDGEVVPVDVSVSAIEFELEAGRRWISLSCSPLRPRSYGADDDRALGVCVRSVGFEPVSAREPDPLPVAGAAGPPLDGPPLEAGAASGSR